MISMKMSKSERKKSSGPIAVGEEGPDYPYGLCLDLNKTVLEKLGLDALPRVGEKMVLTAKVEVVRVSSSAGKGHSDRTLGLQITDMELDSQDFKGGYDAILKAEKKGSEDEE